MTETAVEPVSVEAPSDVATDEQLIAMLVERARSEGLQLTGEGGLLQQLTKRVLGAPWSVRSPTTLATRSTTRPGRTTATAATALARRPC